MTQKDDINAIFVDLFKRHKISVSIDKDLLNIVKRCSVTFCFKKVLPYSG